MTYRRNLTKLIPITARLESKCACKRASFLKRAPIIVAKPIGETHPTCSGSPSALLIITAIRRGRGACCARAVSGHAAAPPSSVMTSRRLMGHLPG
jgi:hypothetical protein